MNEFRLKARRDRFRLQDRFRGDDFHPVPRRGDVTFLPGAERERDFREADAGRFRGPDRAVKDDVSTPLPEFLTLLDWFLAGSGREGDFNAGVNVVGDDGPLAEEAERPGPETRRAQPESEVPFAADPQRLLLGERHLPRPAEVDHGRVPRPVRELKV